MSLGPIVLDVAGTELDADDIRRLQHPLVGGVILFARNFTSGEQLKALTAAIHAVRQPPLLIAVDHEGGRVQRFREGFVHLPPMRELVPACPPVSSTSLPAMPRRSSAVCARTTASAP